MKHKKLIYCYYINMGLITLCKMYSDGNDCDEKPKKIGKYKTEQEAKQICMDHYKKACRIAIAANRPEPGILGVPK